MWWRISRNSSTVRLWLGCGDDDGIAVGLVVCPFRIGTTVICVAQHPGRGMSMTFDCDLGRQKMRGLAMCGRG